MAQIGPKSRVTCFWIAEATGDISASVTDGLSGTNAICCVRALVVDFLLYDEIPNPRNRVSRAARLTGLLSEWMHSFHKVPFYRQSKIKSSEFDIGGGCTNKFREPKDVPR
jgi:hypothetical protein